MHSKYQILAVAVGVSLTAALTGCKDEKANAAPGGPPGGAAQAPAVVVAQAVAQDVPVYIDGIGTAMPTESVTITPRIDGQIIERRFEDGADLKKGQVLFLIDPAPSEAALASAKASLQQAKAAQALAKIELDRYQAVAGTNAVSKSDFDAKKNAVDVAAAQVASAEAAVRTAEINLGYCTVTSPIDGRAGSRRVDVGNVVKENETALLSVQAIDPIYADFTVNESQLAAVRQNMANGTLKTLVSLPSDGPNARREGELTFLDNAVQNATGTIRLRATLDNKDRHFWPGQFVTVRLVLKTLEGAILVPTSAQQLSQTGPYVVVVKADNTAELRPIEVGQQQGDRVVITKGVGAGEQVITDGTLMVRPGGPVRIVPPATQPGQTGPAVPDGGKPTAIGGTPPSAGEIESRPSSQPAKQ